MTRHKYLIILAITVLTIGGWLVNFDSSTGYIRNLFSNLYTRTIVSSSLAAENQLKNKNVKVLGVPADAVDSREVVGLPVDVLMPELTGEVAPETITTTAASALLMDEESGKILYSKDSDKIHSIASITKLFTAMVFLDFNPGWDTYYQIKKTDRRDGGKVFVWAGEKLTVNDLFHLSLVASGNTETLALVNSTGLGEELFVKKMNEKAKELGLKNTVFRDPVGLSEENVSTAREIAQFAKIALARPEITNAVKLSKWKFSTKSGRKAVVSSTDEMLEDTLKCDAKVLGGKTGFNYSAGYCFVGKFENNENQRLISIILGETSKASRFTETEKLVGWAYDNYHWQ
ncbi:MAG: serine hydrolase [bacterium]